MPGKGEKIAGRGWPARKFYLSPEAISLVEKHCAGTPLTMSAYIDALIKRDLAPPQPIEPPAASAERARQAALNRGIAAAKEAIREGLEKQPTPSKDFKLDV